MPPTYATAADFEAYVDGWTTSSAPAVEDLLMQAERDLDREAFVLRSTPAGEDRAIIPADLELEDRAVLRDATCAQAYYRHIMGPEFFSRAQRQRVQGARFSAEGQLPIVGPEAWRELRRASTALPGLSTTTGGRGHVDWQRD